MFKGSLIAANSLKDIDITTLDVYSWNYLDFWVGFSDLIIPLLVKVVLVLKNDFPL